MLQFSYDVTVDDFEMLQVHVGWGDRIRKTWLKRAVLSLALWPALGALYLGIVGAPESGVEVRTIIDIFAVLLVVTGLWLGVTYALHPRRIRRAVRLLLGSRPDEIFLGRQRLELNADGLVIEGIHSLSRYSWSAIQRVDETSNHVFIRVGEIIGIIIPKRGVDPNELVALKAFVVGKIKGRAG